MSGIAKLIGIGAAVSLAQPLAGNIFYPGIVTIPTGMPYRLSPQRLAVNVQATGKTAAIIHIVGIEADWAQGAPVTETVEMLLAPTGAKSKKHSLSCQVPGAGSVRFDHFKGGGDLASDKQYYQGTGLPKAASEIVQDADDGKADGVFTFSFYFFENQDYFSIDFLDAAGKSVARPFYSCQVAQGIFGISTLPLKPAIAKWNGSIYFFTPAQAKYYVPIDGINRVAEVGILDRVWATVSNKDYILPRSAWLIDLAGSMQLRLIRPGNAQAKYQLVCRGTSKNNLGVRHFRQNSNKPNGKFDDLKFFQEKKMINVVTSPQNGISAFTYNFNFGASGQDAIEVRADPQNFDYQSRLDYCAVGLAGSFGATSPQTP